MPKPEYTPGPWKVVEPKNPGPQQENDRLIATEDRKHVAETFQYQNHDNKNGPSIANAHLIAAAPELLDACRSLLACVNRNEPTRGMISQASIERAKTAIAKAIKLGE